MIAQLGSPQNFLQKVFHFLVENGIDCSNFYLDHICYRLDSKAQYLELRKALAKQHDLINESMVNGRPIAIFKLVDPFLFEEHTKLVSRTRAIEILELPSPKENSLYKSGWEHVEFVIDEALEAFIARYPYLDFETKGLDKKLNKDVRLSAKDFSIKFHEQSLEEIIKIEQGVK